MKKHKHIWKILIFDMFVIEFGPVGVFFVAYYLADFLTAALSLGAATMFAMVLSWVVNRRLPWFAIFSGTITILTSLLTYFYVAPWMLIVKDTVYYFLFAFLLGLSLWKNLGLFQAFFGHIFAITNMGWQILERRWFIFFLLAGAANELVRLYLTVDQWVIYKQVIVIVFLTFGLYQFTISRHHRLPEADNLGLRKI
jgi:intracellular septation protein